MRKNKQEPIQLKPKTKRQLDRIKKTGQSYNGAVQDLIDEHNINNKK